MKKTNNKKSLSEAEKDLLLTDKEFYKKYNFDEDEKKLEQSVRRGEWSSIPREELEIEKKRYATYAKYTSLKNKNINIRMAQSDIDKLKAKAMEVGIPYQTIAASILHQYANDKIEVKL